MSDLSDAIKTLAGVTDIDIYSTVCKVESVNIANNNCVCVPIDGVTPDFLGVLLSLNNSNGFLVVPKVSSFVVVSQISEATSFISMVSEVDNIYLAGDSNGGLVKVFDLVAKLNNIENLLNGFITIYNTHTHAVSGAATLVPNLLETNTVTPTVRADIENTKVLHGNG